MSGGWWKGGDGKPAQDPAAAPVRSLSRRLQEWLEKTQTSQQPNTGVWRASGLARLCPRAMALQAVLGDSHQPEGAVDVRLLMRFDVGTAVHRWWQNEYLGPAQILVGKWHCSGCHVVRLGKMPPACGCAQSHQRRPRWEYEEPVFSHREPHWTRPLVGHADGIIIDEPPPGETDPEGLWDLKSWNEAALPASGLNDEQHLQFQAYLFMSKKRWMKVTFVDPMAGFRNKAEPGLKVPAQEMIVYADPAGAQQVIAKVNEAEKALADLKQALTTVFDPARPVWEWPEKICATKSDKKAERCGVADTCFASVLMEKMAIRLREGRNPLTG